MATDTHSTGIALLARLIAIVAAALLVMTALATAETTKEEDMDRLAVEGSIASAKLEGDEVDQTSGTTMVEMNDWTAAAWRNGRL